MTDTVEIIDARNVRMALWEAEEITEQMALSLASNMLDDFKERPAVVKLNGATLDFAAYLQEQQQE